MPPAALPQESAGPRAIRSDMIYNIVKIRLVYWLSKNRGYLIHRREWLKLWMAEQCLQVRF